MRRTALLALLVATSASRVAAEPRPVYAVVRIGSALADDQLVGARRAGLMCLPNGAIHWRDLAAGSGTDRRDLVQDVLEDAGVPTVPLGTTTGGGDGAALRLRGTVTAAAFSLCAKHYGVGDGKALSGDARIEVEWRIEGRAGAERKHLSTAERHLAARDAMSLGELYRALLKDAAQDAARWLAAPSAAS